MSRHKLPLFLHAGIRVLPVALVLLVGAWAAFSTLWERNATARVEQRLAREAEFAADTLSTRLDTLKQSLQSVAMNDLVINGLVDLQSREQYLPTFIRSLRLPGPAGAEITMVDYKGRYIVGNGAPREFQGARWFAETLDREATVVLRPGLLRLAVPIRYQNSTEGMIVVEYHDQDVAKAMALSASVDAIALLHQGTHVLFSSQETFRPTSAGGIAYAQDWLSVGRPVGGGHDLTVVVGLSRQNAESALRSFDTALGSVIKIALVAVLAAILVSAKVAVAPISRMVEQISRITSANHLSRGLPVQGPKELQSLAIAFNASTEALRMETLKREVRERELEDAVRKNAMLATAIEATTTGVSISDPNQPDNPLIYCNNAFYEMTGYGAEDVLGRNCKFLRGEDTDPKATQGIRDAIANHRPTTVELVNYRKDGSAFWNLLTIFPVFDNDGVLINFVGTQQDISAMKSAEAERLRLERELRHSQKMEALGTLAGGIAHEINTPIQYIGDNLSFLHESTTDLLAVIDGHRGLAEAAAGYAGLAEINEACRKTYDDMDVDYLREEAIQAVEQSIEGVKQVANIVLAMKEFSHPVSKDMGLVDLNRVVERSSVVCKSEWKQAACLELDLQADLPQITAQEGALNQVVLNLIVNAAHAVSAKGAEMGRIAIRTRLQDDHVRLVVEDNGTGISEDIRERIFEPFFTTKEVGRGTGQGLALVHDIIVKKHSGTVNVASREGQGTTMTVTLPVVNEPAVAA